MTKVLKFGRKKLQFNEKNVVIYEYKITSIQHQTGWMLLHPNFFFLSNCTVKSAKSILFLALITEA